MEAEHVSSEQSGGLQGGRELEESNEVSSFGKLLQCYLRRAATQ